jgi:hypothetical protein
MGQYPKKGSDSTWFARVELGIPTKKKEFEFAYQSSFCHPMPAYYSS